MTPLSSWGKVDFTESRPNSMVSWVCGTWHISALLLNSSNKMAGGTRRLKIIWEKKEKENTPETAFCVYCTSGLPWKRVVLHDSWLGARQLLYVYLCIYIRVVLRGGRANYFNYTASIQFINVFMGSMSIFYQYNNNKLIALFIINLYGLGNGGVNISLFFLRLNIFFNLVIWLLKKNVTLRKEFFLMFSGPVQRSVSRVWVQECDTNGLWHEETAICRQVKWLHASISEVRSFMAICSFWRNALSNTSTASWPNSLGCKQGAWLYAHFKGWMNENELHVTNVPCKLLRIKQHAFTVRNVFILTGNTSWIFLQCHHRNCSVEL